VLMADAPGKVELLESDTEEGAAARAELDDLIRRDTLSEFECPGFQLGYVYRGSPVIAYDDLGPEPEPMLVEYRPTSWPGARLPHVGLAAGSPVYDALGEGFTLLRVGAGAPRAAAMVRAAAAAGVPLSVVGIAAEDPGDAWDGLPLVLVRPDQHVAWRSGTDPTRQEADDMIATVTGRRWSAAPAVPAIATRTATSAVPSSPVEATSPDGRIRYVVRADGSGVDQRRIHADGTEGAPRAFLTRRVAGEIAVDGTGGVWVCDAVSVTRFDGAARPTHTAQLPDGTRLIGCAGTDGARVLVAAHGPGDAAVVWVIDPTEDES